ncbi:decaheme c-type cytochrome MtrF [Ferrimonas pelagia]|uniref:Decaheme c-type cytochrome MtrF n=2 Tax=Ferrimonas pelagia TaxID=1177826 RepID=A0ABP9EK47_9GAMM
MGLLALAVLAIAGCDNGDDGADGNPGPDTPPPAQEVTELNVELREWRIEASGQIFIDFLVTNQDDEGVIGLPSATLLAAQLLPTGFTGAGNSTEWRFLGSETCDTATSCAGEWIDLANGFYRYTTGMTVNDRDDVTYSADATQRIVLKLGGDSLSGSTVTLPVVNESVDFTPNGTEPLYTRELVASAACDSCHTELASIKHGGSYTEMETCVTCHSANRISNPLNVMSGLAHRFHADSELAQFTNCESCHTQEPALANADNWIMNPSQLACGTCHTAIDFPSGQGHPAQADNSNCAACHNPDWTRDAHLMTAQQDALSRFAVDVVSTTLDPATSSLAVVIGVTDPQTGDNYDSPDQLAFLDDLRIYANWGTSFDYSTRSAPSVRPTDVTPDANVGDGQYQYTISGLTIPADTDTDGGAVAVQGRVCVSDSALVDCDATTAQTVAIASSTDFFTAEALGDAMARRTVVNNETCGSCHGDQKLNFHGTRNDLEQQCQLCHNANMAADATAVNQSASSANYSHMVHAIHTGLREGYEDIVYPAPVGDCRQCHIQSTDGDSFALPIANGVPAMAVTETNADGDVISTTFTSITAATCSVCHSSDTAKLHMEQQGALFNVGVSPVGTGLPTESCEVCHGPGRSADVAPSHGLTPAQ